MKLRELCDHVIGMHSKLWYELFYIGLQGLNCSGIARKQQYCDVYWKLKLNVPKITHCI